MACPKHIDHPGACHELTIRVVVSIVALLAAYPASAQTPPGEVDAVQEIVITGTRGKEDAFLSDRTEDLIDATELRDGSPRTLPEALQDAPGVFVQQTNHGGGSPILRGMIGPQVLVLVDGVRFNNSTWRTGPLQYLNLLDPFAASRLEVLRGPGSVLYGSDALGGVLQFFSVSPYPRSEVCDGWCGDGRVLHSAVMGGAWGQAAHARLRGGNDGLGVALTGTWRTHDNIVGGGDIGVQPHSGHLQGHATGRLEYRFGHGALAGWAVSAGWFMGDIRGAGRTDKLVDRRSLQYYDNTDQLVYGRLHMALPSCRTDADLTLSWHGAFERKDGLSLADDLRTRLSATRDEVSVDTVGADIQSSTAFLSDRVVLQYGGMFYQDFVAAERYSSVGATGPWSERADRAYPDGSRYGSYGAYLLLRGEPLRRGAHRLDLSAGYRVHGFLGNAPAGGGLPEVDLSHLGHVGQAGIRYRYQRRAALGLTWSQGFRAPNLQEAVMLGDTGKFFHVPNHGLAPETGDTLELMGRVRLWRIRASWAGYATWLDRLIKREGTTWNGAPEIDGKEVVENVNGGSGLILGTEASVAVVLPAGFSLIGDVTWTFGREDLPDRGAEPLTRIPPLFGRGALRWDAPGGRGFVEAFVRGAAKQDRLSSEDVKDARIPSGGTPAWWTLNLRAGWAPVPDHEDLRITATLENLLDQAYKYHGSGMYAPGIQGIVQMEAGF